MVGNVTKSNEIKVEINENEGSVKRELSWSNIYKVKVYKLA